jgi:hypothetical protein
MMKNFLVIILFFPFIYWAQPTGNKQIDGEFTSYFENGSIREKGKFINGFETDEWQRFYSNGQ